METLQDGLIIPELECKAKMKVLPLLNLPTMAASLRHTEAQSFHNWKKLLLLNKMNSAVPTSYRNVIINHGGM